MSLFSWNYSDLTGSAIIQHLFPMAQSQKRVRSIVQKDSNRKRMKLHSDHATNLFQMIQKEFPSEKQLLRKNNLTDFLLGLLGYRYDGGYNIKVRPDPAPIPNWNAQYSGKFKI